MVIGYSDDMPMTGNAKGVVDSIEHTDDIHQVLSQVITRINTLNGIQLEVEADGRITGINIQDGELFINGNLIRIGTEPGSESDVVIDNGVAILKNILMDKLQGGSLTLGGTVKVKDYSQPKVEYVDEDGSTYYDYPLVDKKFEDALFIRYDNDGNLAVQIDENGAAFSKLSVRELSVESVSEGSILTTQSTSSKVFYIHANPTDAMIDDPTYDGSSADKPLPYTKMSDVMPAVLNHTYTFIPVQYDAGNGSTLPTEHVEFYGILGGGNIVINLNNQVCAWTMSFSKCTVQSYLSGGVLLYNPDSAEKAYSVQNYMSAHLEISNVNFMAMRDPASGEVYDAIKCYYQGFTDVQNCYFEKFRDGIYARGAHKVYTKGNTGTVNRYGAYANYIGEINLAGANISSLVSGKSTFFENGGAIKKIGTVTFPNEPASGDTSKTTTTVPTTATVKTRSWDATTANNKYGSYWVSSGDWKGRVVSGRWTPGGFPSQSGMWIFPQSMRDTLKGKTIKKVTISIYRHNTYGYAQEIPFTIRMHKYLTLPTGTTVPSYSIDTYSKQVTLPHGTRRTFDVTAAFKSIINDGSYAGFGVKSAYDAAHYCSLSGEAKVTVTYV